MNKKTYDYLGTKVSVEFDNYVNGNVCIRLVDEDGDATIISSNTDDLLPPTLVMIAAHNFPYAEEFLSVNNLANKLDMVVTSGYVNLPVYEIPDNIFVEYELEKNSSIRTCCCECGKVFKYPVNLDKFNRFKQFLKRELLIQDALDFIPQKERELFLSGICPECWDKIFGEPMDM